MRQLAYRGVSAAQWTRRVRCGCQDAGRTADKLAAMSSSPAPAEELSDTRDPARDPRLKIGILVVAYNAETTLEATLDRIPHDFRERITEIMVCDDASEDSTLDAGRAWRDRNPQTPTTIVRHMKNLGYGGNQKAGYQMAIDRGLDVVVLLHGDGQYAPECLAEMVAPLERGEADAVFGSRMLEPGAARKGGMPLYKYVGNRILTTVENQMLGSNLSEFHSGYRAYKVSALAALPIQQNTNDFDFDTQIIVQLIDAGRRIVEIPIPTYYGDEICYVNGLKYARDVVRDVAQYRLTKVGIGTHEWVPTAAEYDLKEGEGTSHTLISEMLVDQPPSRILDLGCSGGRLSEILRAAGHTVIGLDSVEILGVRDRVDRFVLGNLEDGIPDEAGHGFDFVVAADVIEHVSKPEVLLGQMASVLGPAGQLVISTPNFGHWYSRGRVAAGNFDYDRRGILDKTHLRFFMRGGLLRMFKSAGLEVRDIRYTGLPLAVLSRPDGFVSRIGRRIDRFLVRLRPTLFGYQFVVRLSPR
jgi:glycosyltransferase involved in cell wall biosynthesis